MSDYKFINIECKLKHHFVNDLNSSLCAIEINFSKFSERNIKIMKINIDKYDRVCYLKTNNLFLVYYKG